MDAPEQMAQAIPEDVLYEIVAYVLTLCCGAFLTYKVASDLFAGLGVVLFRAAWGTARSLIFNFWAERQAKRTIPFAGDVGEALWIHVGDCTRCGGDLVAAGPGNPPVCIGPEIYDELPSGRMTYHLPGVCGETLVSTWK